MSDDKKITIEISDSDLDSFRELLWVSDSIHQYLTSHRTTIHGDMVDKISRLGKSMSNTRSCMHQLTNALYEKKRSLMTPEELAAEKAVFTLYESSNPL